MNGVVRRRPRAWLLECMFAIMILALLGRAMWTLYSDGYLHQPFFYDASDTWMDWFNTAYWARDPGVYDVWGTIYPPLSFVVLRLAGLDVCYSHSAIGSQLLTIRECDWLGIVAIHAIYLLDVALIAFTFIKTDRRTAFPRAVALAAGAPMLFALERGNILLLTFACFLLAFGPLLKSARLRWVFAGLAINFKVYLIGALMAQLLKRRWLWVEGGIVATIIVYVVTYAVLGTGSPTQIINNITDYSSGLEVAQVTDVWYSISYGPLISLFQSSTFPANSMIGSRIVDAGLLVFPLLVRTGQAAIILAAIATWLRPEVVSSYRVAFLGTALALISSEVGGYAQVMAILLVFLEPWHGIARSIAIVLCYILCLPSDIIISQLPPLTFDSFLVSHSVEVHLGIGLGMFLRPGILIAIAILLSATTIRDVWVDIRTQGWRGRWRYRRDVPLLPGIARPARTTTKSVDQSQST